MLIVFDTKTFNVLRFIRKLPFETHRLSPLLTISDPFVLVTYTCGFGEVPSVTQAFMHDYDHRRLIRGVAVSGNRNWGENFGKAGDTLSAMYGVPLIHKFELSGQQSDVNTFIEGVRNLEVY
jgi:protein involved in ribonucleotide reduction